MNLKGKLSTNASLTGNASIPTKINTGGGASTWNEISGKPFNTLGEDFTVTGGELGINSSSLLDGYATEQYVDDAIADIPATDWDDITNKPSFATVATTGDYDDLLNKPTIPIVPTDVSAFNNDAGYITSSALTGYATEIYVNSATATVYDSITTTLGDYATKNYAEGLTTGLASESYVDIAISNIPDPDWSDVQNKPTFATVATSGDYDDLDNKPTIPTQTSVSVTQGLTTGVTVGSIDVDGITTSLYAPTPTVVGITNTLATGTAIADIHVNGVTTTLYAPAGGGSSTQSDWIQTDNTQDDYINNKPAVIADTVTGSQGRGVILGRFPTATSTGLYAGNNCVAFGYNTYSSNAYTQIIADSGRNTGGAIAFGRIDKQTGKIQASNSGSMAFGYVERSGDIKATKVGSLAFGHADYSVIEATGDGSLSGGYTSSSISRKTSASGGGAIAFGDGAQATKSNSQAFGLYTSANSAYQMAVGKHNVADSSSVYRFIVGNGTSSSALNNCFAAGADGNIYTAGSLYANVSDWTNPTTSGTKMAIIPEPPTTDGTYTLQVVITNGEPAYSWV